MPWTIVVMIVYGLFNIVLGVEAFMAKGSFPSLLAAGGAGLIVIACAALARTHPRIAYITATVIALLIAGRFMKPAFEGKFYPAQLTVVVSLLFAVVLVGAHFAAVAKRKRDLAAGSVEP